MILVHTWRGVSDRGWSPDPAARCTSKDDTHEKQMGKFVNDVISRNKNGRLDRLRRHFDALHGGEGAFAVTVAQFEKFPNRRQADERANVLANVTTIAAVARALHRLPRQPTPEGTKLDIIKRDGLDPTILPEALERVNAAFVVEAGAAALTPAQTAARDELIAVLQTAADDYEGLRRKKNEADRERRANEKKRKLEGESSAGADNAQA